MSDGKSPEAIALQCVSRLYEIERCDLKLQIARQMFERASVEMEYWKLRRKIADARNQGVSIESKLFQHVDNIEGSST